MYPNVINTSPISPPAVGVTPKGRKVPFDFLVRTGGMRNVVTLPSPPDVRIHGGERDFKVPRPGATSYCIAGATLPSDPKDRAVEILRRLAYGFGEYASREVVARYNRDQKAANRVPIIETEDQARIARRSLSIEAMRVRRALRKNAEATIGELAKSTGMAQPNVSRAVAALVANGIVRSRRIGKNVLCRITREV